MIVYVCTYFLKGFSFSEHFYTKEEIIKLAQEGKSIIRLGDGEINLLLDLNNHYHTFNPRLKTMIKEIVTSYKQESNYVLSVPQFINFSNEELKKIGKFNVWLPLKVMFFLMFPKKIGYMDAHNFYYDTYFENVIAPVIQDKKIICITRRETTERLKSNGSLPWKNIVYIETPESDAIASYDEITKQLDRELEHAIVKDVVLLVAMGPVGKYLIFEYTKKGYQGIDPGMAVEVIFTGKSIQYLI